MKVYANNADSVPPAINTFLLLQRSHRAPKQGTIKIATRLAIVTESDVIFVETPLYKVRYASEKVLNI
ncbi:hypothetical protein AL042_10655 [Pseudomonas amygdali pv. aesculi]|nr:hypothetical protein AL041_28090 [Pseudomonas amygdali pv. aesculi]KWT29321.1 hypothetical protein AL042_10655 [Pseudomonas amygdali pv. aesculi]